MSEARAKFIFIESTLDDKFKPLVKEKNYKPKEFQNGSKYPFFTVYEQQGTSYITEKNVKDLFGDNVFIAKQEESETMTVYETKIFFFNKKEVTGHDKEYLSKLGEFLHAKFEDKITKPLFITFSAEFEDCFIPENISSLVLLSSSNREMNTNFEELGFFFKDYQEQIKIAGVYKNWDEVGLAFDLTQNKHGISISQNKRHTSTVLAFNFSIDWNKFFTNPNSVLWTDNFWESYLIPLLWNDSIPFAQKSIEVKRVIVNYRTYAAEYAEKAAEQGTKEITKLRGDIKACDDSIQAGIDSITSSKRKKDDYHNRLVSLEKELVQQNTKERLFREFEAVSKMVKNLELTSDGHVVFYLDAIPIEGNGPVIGPYKITCGVSTADMKVENTGNPKEGHAHPHCPQGGKPCIGNYTDVYYHISKFELCNAVELIKIFLSSVNLEDSWGQRLGNWDKDFMFQLFVDQGLERKIESRWNEDFKKWSKGRSLPGMEVAPNCTHCGFPQASCACEFCSVCGSRVAECTCERCDDCGERVVDCICEAA
jgi:hypothetical protein